MKQKRLLARVAMAGAALVGDLSGAPPRQATVIVCMQTDHVLMGVRPLASKMFASIGVRIDWRERDACPAGRQAIQIRMSHDSRSMQGSSAEALAFALPYQGTVVVFPDRVEELNRDRVRALMAHVLVHEITHVLQGVDRHSASGIMKPKWSDRERSDMASKPLSFAQEDVDLIHAALLARAQMPDLVAPVKGERRLRGSSGRVCVTTKRLSEFDSFTI